MSVIIEGYTAGWMISFKELAQRENKGPELDKQIVISDIALTELEDLRMTEYQIPLDTLDPEFYGYL